MQPFSTGANNNDVISIRGTIVFRFIFPTLSKIVVKVIQGIILISYLALIHKDIDASVSAITDTKLAYRLCISALYEALPIMHEHISSPLHSCVCRQTCRLYDVLYSYSSYSNFEQPCHLLLKKISINLLNNEFYCMNK